MVALRWFRAEAWAGTDTHYPGLLLTFRRCKERICNLILASSFASAVWKPLGGSSVNEDTELYLPTGGTRVQTGIRLQMQQTHTH